MNIIFIPGLFAPAGYLDPLREVLEDAGHTVSGPGFVVNTLLSGEFQTLIETLDGIRGSVVLIGHSAGGMLATLAAAARLDVHGVIGLGSSVAGLVQLEVPHYEARSMLGGLLVPLVGPDEVKIFPVGHASLPFTACVQDWVLDKLEEIDA
ncbi:hypothetical protein LCGC14_2074600 [marine sediment metagenome]|uniref:AB hydrolase-1 domain-containing protein n=1 Tax=marine sediment metagenome TaxID=412755 RepID=A0A0F9GVQ3_9ZZZZ